MRKENDHGCQDADDDQQDNDADNDHFLWVHFHLRNLVQHPLIGGYWIYCGNFSDIPCATMVLTGSFC